jgi:serum/glucocorticoid-regulated kinase 2
MGNCCKKKDSDSNLDELVDNQESNPLGIKLTFHDFEKLKVLGKCSFGEVLLVKLKANNKYYAMKILIKKQVKLRHQEVHTKAERDLMVRINCPFIVNIKFAFQDNINLYIITEFMQGGEMFFHLHREKRFSNEKTRFYVIEMILAIEFLHKNKMFYRDLKPENIMVDASGHIKLTDFGLSKMVKKHKDKAFTICGTPQYLAPEILSDEGYDGTVDWWSLGCVMFEMLSGKAPFRIPKGTYLSADLYKKKISLPDYVTPEAKDLVSQLLVTNPKKRLGYGTDGAKKIKEHPYFEGINWEDAWNRKLQPPFVPKLKGETDLSYFDKMFTDEKIDGSKVSEVPSSIDNSEYKGFTFVTNSVTMELMEMKKTEENN